LWIKMPDRWTDCSYQCSAGIKHQYSCTSEHHLCQSWPVMWWHLHLYFMYRTFNMISDATFTDCYSSKH